MGYLNMKKLSPEEFEKQVAELNRVTYQQIEESRKEHLRSQLAADEDGDGDEDEDEDESPLGSNLKFPLSREDGKGFPFILRKGMRRLTSFLEPLVVLGLSQNGASPIADISAVRRELKQNLWGSTKDYPTQYNGIAIRKDGEGYIITCPIGRFSIPRNAIAPAVSSDDFNSWIRPQLKRKGNKFVIEIPASVIKAVQQFSPKKYSAKARYPGILLGNLFNITVVDVNGSAVIEKYTNRIGEDGATNINKAVIEKTVDGGGSTFYNAYTVIQGIAVAEFRVPMSQMQYLTQEEVPGMNYAVDLIAGHYEQAFLRGPKAARLSISISDIAASVATRNLEAAKEFFSGKLNQDRIGYHSDGSLYRIEPMLANITTDNVKMYENMLTSLVKTERDENTFSVNDIYGSDILDPQMLKAKMGIENPVYKMGQSIIYADFVNKKISYTTNEGGLTIFDLDDFIPASSSHYLKNVLNIGLVTDGVELELAAEHASSVQYINLILREAYSSKLSTITPEELIDLDKVSDGSGQHVFDNFFKSGILAKNIASIFSLYNRYVYRQYTSQGLEVPLEFHWVEETKTIKLKDINPNSDIPFLRVFGRLIQEYAQRSVFQSGNTPELEFLRAKRSPVSAMSVEATLFVLAKFSQPSSVKALEVETEEAKSNYRTKANLSEISITSIPYIKKDRMVMFHQQRIFAEIMDSPVNSVISAMAGAGKTFVAVYRSCIEMKRGNLPILIACPSHLVKDYIKEFNYFTAGRVNTVVITNATIKNFGKEKIELLIKNMPVNSVAITDYDFIKGKTKHIGYGTKSIPVSPNAEFLRKFNFKLMIADESHYLKNASGRSASVKRLIRDIPMKMLMSGTFIADTLVDVPAQFGLMDHSAFGSRQNFIDEFALEVSGGRVISWKPTAFQDIKKRMSENCKMVEVNRKEWSAFLPPKTVDFHNVTLTPKQLEVYRLLMASKIEELQQQIAGDPAFKEIWDAMQEGEESTEMDDAIEAFMGPVLQDIERFLSAPMDSKFAHFLTNPVDQISPKALKTYELCKMHLDQKIPGKILIFCKYHSTVNAIYDNMPADLKAKTIHYTAGKKIQCTIEFEKDPKKQIMIGIEDSMNTGLNLQFASRLIRLESVWSPGSLEQGESRINRPNIKDGSDSRPRIYFDWVLAEKTYDILKSTRVLSKICNVSKFNNAEDPRYDDLVVPPAIPIRISTLQGLNDFSELSPYFESYSSVLIKDKDSATEWRTKNADAKPILLEEGEVLPNSKILRSIPYVPGMDLFGADDLGLERASDFMTEEGQEKIVGKYIHTEDGDGVCEGTTPNGKLKVRNLAGKLVSYNTLSVFVINKKVTNTMEIRKNFVKLTGLKSAGDIFQDDDKADQPILEEKEKPSKLKKPLPNEDLEENQSINLFALAVNDMFALAVDSDDPDVSEQRLKDYGFKIVPTYYSAPITTAKQLLNLVETLVDNPNKFVISTNVHNRLKALWMALKSGGKEGILRHPSMQEVEIKNFYRIRFKPLANPKEVRIFPMVSNGKLFLAVDPIASPATRKLLATAITGVKWTKSTGELYSFFARKNELISTAKELIADKRVKIANIENLKEQIKTLKVGGKKQDKE